MIVQYLHIKETYCIVSIERQTASAVVEGVGYYWLLFTLVYARPLKRTINKTIWSDK
jgi:hypothetical protein